MNLSNKPNPEPPHLQVEGNQKRKRFFNSQKLGGNNYGYEN